MQDKTVNTKTRQSIHHQALATADGSLESMQYVLKDTEPPDYYSFYERRL